MPQEFLRASNEKGPTAEAGSTQSLGKAVLHSSYPAHDRLDFVVSLYVSESGS